MILECLHSNACIKALGKRLVVLVSQTHLLLAKLLKESSICVFYARFVVFFLFFFDHRSITKNISKTLHQGT